MGVRNLIYIEKNGAPLWEGKFSNVAESCTHIKYRFEQPSLKCCPQSFSN